MVTKTMSMKYPQLQQIPRDAKIRFLGDVHASHFIQMDSGDSFPGESMQRECVDSSVDVVVDHIKEAFAPFPVASLHTMEEMQMRSRLMRMNMNAIEIRTKRVPIPKRKKKSWLRYSSNKKWARKFPKRVFRQVAYPSVKTLSVSGDMFQKLKSLAEFTKTAAPLGGAVLGPIR